MKTLKAWAAAAALLALTGTAQAALIPQGNGTVLDDTTNLVWLQDWNRNGQKTWGAQTEWAESLDYAGSNDWVLPTLAQFRTLNSYLPLLTGFTDVQDGYYWTSSDVPGTTNDKFAVVPTDGFGANNYVFGLYSAVAVRPWTQVTAVPEPQTLALALLALGAIVVAYRRRPA